MNARRLTPVVLALFAAASVSTAGQALTPDQKELAAYTLTMPTVRKVAAVMQRLNDLESKNPKVQELAKIRAEIEALEQKDELSEADEQRLEKLREREEALDEEIDRESGAGDAASIDDLVKRVESQPDARAALAQEGLTAREFAKTFLALLQAAMVKGFSQGKVDMAKLPAGINPENIRFVEENEKELAAIQAAMSGQKKH
jgi:hypothetical protein